MVSEAAYAQGGVRLVLFDVLDELNCLTFPLD